MRSSLGGILGVGYFNMLSCTVYRDGFTAGGGGGGGERVRAQGAPAHTHPANIGQI